MKSLVARNDSTRSSWLLVPDVDIKALLKKAEAAKTVRLFITMACERAKALDPHGLTARPPPPSAPNDPQVEQIFRAKEECYGSILSLMEQRILVPGDRCIRCPNELMIDFGAKPTPNAHKTPPVREQPAAAAATDAGGWGTFLIAKKMLLCLPCRPSWQPMVVQRRGNKIVIVNRCLHFIFAGSSINAKRIAPLEQVRTMLLRVETWRTSAHMYRMGGFHPARPGDRLANGNYTLMHQIGHDESFVKMAVECWFEKLQQLSKAHRILGLRRGATSGSVIKRYRLLALKYHSDKTKGSDERMKDLNEAKALMLEIAEEGPARAEDSPCDGNPFACRKEWRAAALIRESSREAAEWEFNTMSDTIYFSEVDEPTLPAPNAAKAGNFDNHPSPAHTKPTDTKPPRTRTTSSKSSGSTTSRSHPTAGSSRTSAAADAARARCGRPGRV
ncbi:unnamed protein product [Vitrella brassicaformis CCMP3155]|uniref:J domain-containing protein n=1 Tax=Vitrella brassicaformis (strain CCMP3155) TaxID=1169540 RepID=A0A0G4GF26_VITBC|nr:unnamed protein product [Vitrella brassicaformis CCMP3155]|eukprot:CEM28134.1 unnamed protein product [Vitrella brassicaformis CCMP3155]